ncbi:hypothetical protein EXU48_23820 [Occultella glacieicola]|uniref:TrbL/VirB6 plasmid conjugal transfer protein n=1 Tax=Occultella glacieicola TaxID=2518684 RepID=A0ABY2DXH9_9MICO|nr:hypothetical protein [Occultella glacieicola]TDE88152.1 hypothetical protein EXU48_23820 [Occultella glacieicola]
MPTPTLAAFDGENYIPSEAVAFIRDSVWWYTLALAVVAVLIGALRMAWERRGQPLADVLKALVTLVVVSGAGIAAIGLLVTAGDEFSVWVIARSPEGTDFGQNIVMLGGRLTGNDALGAVMVIAAGTGLLLLSLVQIVLLVFRGAMLVLLAGMLPTAAAFTNTPTGSQWFKKYVGWTIAFILYKPIAALIYATAFQLMGIDLAADESGVVTLVQGITLMALALVAMPALMRFVAPAVSAVAGGGGGGAALAGLGSAALAVMPTGAVAAGASGAARTATTAASGAASASSGSSGSSGPQGAAGTSPSGSGNGGTSGGGGQGQPQGASAPPGGQGSGSGGSPTGSSAGGSSGGKSGGEKVAAGASAAGSAAQAASAASGAINNTIESGGPDGSR